MGFFKKKKSGYVDLGEKLSKQEAKLEKFQTNTGADKVYNVEEQAKPQESSSGGFMNFFGAPKAQETTSNNTEKKRKLKAILDGINDRLDEQDKEIYQLKQKIEILERS